MKLLCTFFLFCSFFVQGQLKGHYNDPFTCNTTDIWFRENNEFSYRFVNCLGQHEFQGKGHYIKKWGKLTLLFETDSAFQVAPIVNADTLAGEKSQTRLDITVTEGPIDQGIFGATLQLTDSAGNVLTKVTDFDGHVLFQLPGSGPYSLSISDSGQEWIIPVKSAHSMQIKLPDPYIHSYVNGDIKVFRYRKFRAERLLLKAAGRKRFVRFSREETTES